MTLGASPGGIVTILGSITIPAGSSTGTFNVAGTGAGTTNITASASGYLSGSASITVVTPVAITTSSLPTGFVGVFYSASAAATGGTAPYTFSATGLPAGLSMNVAGAITGTPTTAGTTTAAITVTDSTIGTHLTTTVNLSVTINPPLTITTASLPTGFVGNAYSTTVTATGGTPPYTFTATGLPPGLSIGTGGAITGSPTATGSSMPAITVTDSTPGTHLTKTANLLIMINAGVTITTTSLPTGFVGLAYSSTIVATGGATPYTFTATGLPAGLSLNAAGVITGTPTTAGTTTAAILVTDSTPGTHLTGTANLPITINPALAITTTSLPNGFISTGYNATVMATGGTPPYSFTATGLPASLFINSIGQITGSPTVTGTTTAAITVTDSTPGTHLTVTSNLPITINPALAITTLSLPAGFMGTAYNTTVTAVGGTTPYTFTATGLPAGLSISAAGAIVGSPTAAGTTTATITVTDSTPGTHLTNTANLSITINPGLAITTASLPAGFVGTAYSATVAASGGTTPYTFTATGLPGGLSISTTGQVTGSPTTAGTTTAAITVTDSTTGTHLTNTVNFPITINPGLAITTASLPSGFVNSAYSATVVATGGTSPYTFTASGLPAGLSISTGGAITGSPTAAGTVTAVITATDSTPGIHLNATANLSITISPALAITTSSLPTGFVGTAYSTTVTATGGTTPYTFTATGLPGGLSISTGGAITGNPTTTGTVTAAITVTDSTPGTHFTKTANLSITINPGVAITTSSLPTGFVGTAYNFTVTATGGTTPYTFTATGLPGGLSISTGGAITGSPTTAGTTTAAITVTDSTTGTHLTNTANLSITINPALAITTASLPTGFTGTAYNTTVTATGGTTPYTFTATGLPAGLSISTGGAITGSPTTAGTTTAAITVTDSTPGTHLTNTANLSITIESALTITTGSLASGVVGVAYNATVAATGGATPYTFTATGLPGGLSISAGGAITGSPTTAGTTTAAITVTDSTPGTHLTNTANLSITINSALAITTTTLPNGFVGVGYNTTVLATGGTTPYTFSANGLPSGLFINSLGQITGSPSALGTTTAAITVTDSTPGTHQTTTANLSITVNPALSITTLLLPGGYVGAPYSATVAATGGTSPYTFTATGLPAGLSISAGGAITGTPTLLGTSTPVITATDSTPGTHLTATANFSITINPGLVITTTTLPSGLTGTAYAGTVLATGGTAPYTFTATGLPAGLSIGTNGQITGSPTTAGTVTAAITATDSTAGTHLTTTANLSITIVQNVAITTSSLPNGFMGVAYSAAVAAIGGTQPYTFTATGLPGGLSMNTAGAITGSPTVTGSSTAVVTVTDSTPGTHLTATANLSITVNPGLAITTTSLPVGFLNTAYSTTVTATGGTSPYTFTATGLPAGLSISAGGAITGSPTTGGTTTAAITVTDSTPGTHLTKTANLSITINAGLAIITTSLSSGVVAVPYNATVTAGGGTTPYTFTATGLPAGLSISTGGVITGSPTTAGTVTAAITVTDSTTGTHLTNTANLSITINPPLTISSTSLSAGTVNSPYNANVTATGGTQPYNFSATGLPAGLSISSSGHITGTPSAVGTTNVSFTVTDNTNPIQTANATLAITIAPQPLTITTATLPSGIATSAYAATVTASGGTTPYSFSATGLPAGLSIGTNGQISGTPTTPGTTTATIKVTDASNPTLTATATYSILVIPFQPSMAITNATLGQNLQVPVTVTFYQPGTSLVNVIISSNNPDVYISGTATAAGGPSLTVTGVNPTLSPSFVVYVQSQGQTNSGTATLTVQASGGFYLAGTSTVTVVPSGFVLSGPNGVGASFTANQGSTTPLSVSAEAMDSSGNLLGIEAVSSVLPSVTVSFNNSAPTIGTVPASVSIPAGTSTVNTQIVANSTTPGNTLITAQVPTGFATPAQNANAVTVTVQAASINTNTIKVGQGLSNFTTVSLQATPTATVTLTITSNDTTKLLLATSPTLAGAASITLKITSGHTTSPNFYVYGVGNTGTAGYTVTASGGFTGTAIGSVTLAQSGFVLSGPFGVGQNFSTTVGVANQVDVLTAVLDAFGNPTFDQFGDLISQPVAGGTTVTANVNSSNLSNVGGFTTPSATFTGDIDDVTLEFLTTGPGTTVLSVATPSGFTTPTEDTSIEATVGTPAIRIDAADTVGQNLEQEGSIELGAPAPAGGLQITLSSNNTSGVAFSSTGTDAGATTLTFTVAPGSFSAQYYVYGLASTGTVTITASATGYSSGTGAVTLAPSGIVIDPDNNSINFPLQIPLSGGTTSIPIETAVLTPGSLAYSFAQPLAGGLSVSVSVSNTNTAAGTVSTPVTITTTTGGVQTASTSFSPLLSGASTTLGVTPLTGTWQAPLNDATIVVDVE